MLNENQLDYLNFKVSEAKRAYNYYTDVKLSALALQQKSHMEAYEEVIEGLKGLESDSEVLSSPCRLVEGGEQLTSQELEEEAYRGCEGGHLYSLVITDVECSEELIARDNQKLGEVVEILTTKFGVLKPDDMRIFGGLLENESYSFPDVSGTETLIVSVVNLGDRGV